ncbi:MAG: DUF177 domain-containing protein [Acidobacteria bacterium]|nr:DUF177 domain-containing protein [Acidobacteriota bacterium]
MFIEVQDLKQEPFYVRHVFPIGEIKYSHEDAGLSEPVVADFVLTHRDRDLHVNGTVETAIRYRCSRCTKEFSKAFNVGFDLTYLPQPKWTNEDAEIALKYDEMNIAYYDGIALDVNLMVLEQIELAMPMRFVCREDCKGLCYKCGADLNEGLCSCKDEETDFRLSVLLEFRQKKMEK